MAGRPTDYTLELATRICARVAMGESLRKVAQDAEMPAGSTIWKWLAEHKEFSEQYARACEERSDNLVEEMLTIPDEEEDVQRARLKVDVRKWYASKLKPKKYGDKLDVEHNGSVTVEIVRFSEDTPAE